MKKIYIFDLDHTLFHARKFREDLGLLVANDKNTSTEKIWEAFERRDKKLLNFIQTKTAKYLFPNVIENLQKILESKILLSFGNIDFQAEKIKALKLEKIFDEIILTDQNKIKFLERFIKEHQQSKIFFINDNYNKRFQENKEIAEKIPQIKILEVDNYLLEKKKTISEIFTKI